LGYAPLGLLLGLRFVARDTGFWRSTFMALLACALLSFAMEALQTYLDARVSSNADWLLNIGGVACGLLGAWIAHGLGLVGAWRSWRDGRLDAQSTSQAWVVGVGASLLLLWPLLLLYPSPTPLGLGQVFDQAVEPLSATLEAASVACGLLIPVLLGYALVPAWTHRLGLVFALLSVALAMSSVATGLAYGAQMLWVWLREPIVWGLLIAVLASVFLVGLPRRWAWVSLVTLVLVHLLLVNVAPQDPYYAQQVGDWEAGRFVRFYGVTQGLSAAWPFAVFVLALIRLMSARK